MPVWRDADGNFYDSWDELGLEHLKNVVVLLTKRAEEYQKEWKRIKRRKAEQAELTLMYYSVEAEERWRLALFTLEDASRALKRRLNSDNVFELDPVPATPPEALSRAGRVLADTPRRAGKQRGTSVREGKIIERPRKLRIETR